MSIIPFLLQCDTTDFSRRRVTDRNVDVSEETKEQMFGVLVEHFNDHRKKINPSCKPNWSPSQKHQFGLLMSLLRETPPTEWSTVPQLVNDQRYSDLVRDWLTAMEHDFSLNLSGETDLLEPRGRRVRQNKSLPDATHRRSSRPHAQTNNVFDSDDEMAYDDENEMSGSDEQPPHLDEDGTVHDDDLHKYPGRTFHHKGNRFYRPGLAPDGKRGSIVIAPNGEKRKWDEYVADVEDGEEASKNGDADDDDHTTVTYSKSYVTSHPEIEFVHRGKGRYKRKDDLEAFEASRKKLKLATSVTPTASSDRRSSRADNSFTKDYADSHMSDELFRSGRAKRNSKPRIDPIEADIQDRRHTITGQGKQIRRNSTQSTVQRGVAGAQRAPAVEEGLVDSAYVEAHPNETFHHRGQGKWARGLPPPGSSNKTAVRGPDKDKPWQTQGDRIGIDVDAHGNRAPPPATLLLKVDGPDKWPNLQWTYRGGGKWWRQSKEGVQQAAIPVPRKRLPVVGRGRLDGPEAQLQREARAAEKVATDSTRWKGKGPAAGHLQRPKIARGRSHRGGLGDAGSSHSHSKAAMKTPKEEPRPALLPPEDDVLTEEDLPGLYKEDWSEDEIDDEASHIMRATFRPIVGPEPFVAALAKHAPAARSLPTLLALTSNAQWAMEQLQKEFLENEKIIAMHPPPGKKERKPAKGGRTTVEPEVHEDRKEALLYDYTYDSRKTGYQDPDAQRIVRDPHTGAELRRRRPRVGADSSLPNGVNYGDGEMTTKRTVKPVSRFDGVVVQPPRKRSRLTTGAETPDESRATTPMDDEATDKALGPHLPKRLQELRHESVGTARSASEDPGAKSPGASGRKGRPPGSKNLFKRKDAGIKKGPRKPKMASLEPNGSAEPESAAPESIEDSPTPA